MGLFGCTKQNNFVSKEKKMTIKNPHIIYIRESYSDKIKAIFSGSTSKETEEVNLKRIKSSDDYNTVVVTVLHHRIYTFSNIPTTFVS